MAERKPDVKIEPEDDFEYDFHHEVKLETETHQFCPHLAGLQNGIETTYFPRLTKYQTDRLWFDVHLQARLEQVTVGMRRSMCANYCVLARNSLRASARFE
uniref:Uncharacterized protein n=1 Tax=Timema bartmani TaxID=61472 RepID=A0A7R9I441_9NEOP|nr:unnamed protein product [Timema bartmani]